LAAIAGRPVGALRLWGCSLFPAAELGKNVRLNRPSLPPIQTAADSVQLEVFFVDRPADDPLLGPSLWREIDQIAAIPAETRKCFTKMVFWWVWQDRVRRWLCRHC